MLLLRFFKITDKTYLNALSQAGTIGLHMVSGVAVGTAMGYGLDSWLDSSPVCTLVFMALGVAAGFKNVYRDTKQLIATQKQEDAERFSSGGEAATAPSDIPASAKGKHPSSDGQPLE